MSVPRGTVRSARFSVRVPAELKADVHALVGELRRGGLRSSESELVEFFVAEGVACGRVDGDERGPIVPLGERLRAWRAQQETQA